MSHRKNYKKSAIPLAAVLIISVLIAALAQTPNNSSERMQRDFEADQESPRKLARDFEPDQLKDSLLVIARAALEAEKTLLVQGKSAVNEENLVARTDGGDVQDRVTEITDLRDELASKEISYTDFTTELTAANVAFTRFTATLWATEHTTLALKTKGGPPATAYEQNHRFDFRFQDGEWKLISDQLINPAPPEGLETGEMLIFTTPTQTSAPEGSVTEDPEGCAVEDESQASDAAKAKVNLNRPAIAEYARRYYKNYNKKYRAESWDCTNFASQALYAGSAPMVLGWYRSNSVWWYNGDPLPPYHSWTWGGAHNLYWFLSSRPRGTIAKYISDLKIGDLLQADLFNAKGKDTPDGTIDHTMIVTGKSSKGEIFLTYHTDSTLDRSFTEVKKKWPKAKWYGWRLNDYPN